MLLFRRMLQFRTSSPLKVRRRLMSAATSTYLMTLTHWAGYATVTTAIALTPAAVGASGLVVCIQDLELSKYGLNFTTGHLQATLSKLLTYLIIREHLYSALSFRRNL